MEIIIAVVVAINLISSLDDRRLFQMNDLEKLLLDSPDGAEPLHCLIHQMAPVFYCQFTRWRNKSSKSSLTKASV